MIASLLLALVAANPQPVDTLVVCPPPFVEALQPWLQYRRAQGHEIQLLTRVVDKHQVRDAIRLAAKPGTLRHVLLVGDADPRMRTDRQVRARSIPTHLADAEVNVRWGSEPQLATDNWYADLNDDRVPDVAIGRLTVDTPDELKTVINKIVQYEASTGTWQQRVNFVAGVGGFGKVADTVLEMATKQFVTEGIPHHYSMTMTYGSWRSPFCPDPRQFRDATVARLNEGCLFWIYIGHGQRRYLDRVRVPGGSFHIMDVRDVPQMASRSGAPIAVFLACYTGAFDEPQDCLAEEMLRQPGGPVGILGGSRVTMPYAMAVMGNALMEEYFQNRQPTIGEVLMHAKQKMVAKAEAGSKANNTLSNRMLLDALASAISPSKDLLEAERLEHVALFNLIGDPLLRMPHPEPLELELAKEVRAGDSLLVKGSTPLQGEGVVELVCRRDRFRSKPPARDQFISDDASLAAYNDAYQSANDRRYSSHAFQSQGGPFSLELPIPVEARGPCYVRITLHGKQSAAGSQAVYVRSPRKPPLTTP